ncbi:hypothetical protein UFOVP669_26 [uncultured Caudovirales phage]|uniref:Phage-related protein n=1 Tax=uncultured Caudovirales phage TaxID=2100421 RepID=A0A6J5NAK7_9CAUD|nr:hypothetical protein UFOVP400_17 [uncultured Caudovirales phage]CAB4155767.1 hypothetical protein UFOVP669_26 [uncultured Caudovirales phage]CAB4213540.1 hypothetical protein UFOVP1449_45 [uncultured Caudovirales phage]
MTTNHDALRERPILFSGPMVRALLDGSKTQTRRVVKLPRLNPLGTWEPTRFGGPGGGRLASGAEIPEHAAIWHTRTGETIACPYGQPGDRLWVREAFAFTDAHEPAYEGSIEYRADNKSWAVSQRELHDVPHNCDPRPFDGPWKPSIHMPRWASRITLEVTAVRVERLQDISEADAIAEGIERVEDFFGCPCWKCYGEESDVVAPDDPIGSYRSLWEQLNGPGSWDANPWAWVVEFRRIKP